MKNNTILLIAGAAIIYFLMKKKAPAKAPALPPSTTASLMAQSSLPQYENKPGIFEQMLPNGKGVFIETIKSQTVNFPQVAPSPASVMDLPGMSYNQDYGCGCNQVGKMPYIC
jgi:hypothetical protein